MSRRKGVIERRCRLLGDIPRRRGLTARELQAEYLKPRLPVVLQGCMDHWPGFGKWNLDYVAEVHGDVEVNVGRLFHIERKMTLRDYVDYVAGWRREHDDVLPDELPLYADGCMVSTLPKLADDFQIPACFTELDWFERFLPRHPLGQGYLLLGPKGSMTKLHIDGHYSHAWVAQFAGRKRWNIVPFDALKGFFPGGYFDYIAEWEGIDPPGLEEHPGVEEIGYHSTVLEPGEIIVAPSGQFHEVYNLDDSVALSSNFLERSNARKAAWSLLLARTGIRRAKPRYGPF